MKLQKFTFLTITTMLVIIALTSCMPNPEHDMGQAPSGFFSGVWHGWVAPFSLIVGFFNDHTRVYDPNNTGWWYDFGFYMAVISGFGGLSLARKKAES
ncbi:MAG: hypothetical protein HOB84_05555 [Candidatus Marinimicrobia bacterium]|jgi:hypothetical protein|nr:hypothetical protein [Candidatus Neomarinimicrobiota bacterium]MBT4359576.1 hypothetical protein [Candidatus Neomarinimicrobiota bacterium]MBT4714218.1 hypothetical protein [Candidatus Neomarinimicrobiota bacterium]MBT4945526.1 hypothetical protein [Candidatus Neomarinimicrobiota bacterium]MBT5314190.1 hypothetical protein [Candidatus Neomarinimicrobiota bacterium]